MKKFPASRRFFKLSSFTLVELLVVIAIIAILASVILYGATAAINSAKRAKAFNTATQIQTAALSYYTEYSVYPVGSATTDAGALITDVAASKTSWGNLIEALCGNIKPTDGTAATQTAITNSRGIAFLSLKSSDVDSNDAPNNPLSTGTQIYFNIAFDADYDGVIGASGTPALPKFPAGSSATLPLTGGTSTAGVAVWANCTGKLTLTNSAYWVHTY